MKNWQIFLLVEIVVDILLGWQFFLWRWRRLCFWPTLASWAWVGWGVFVLIGAMMQHGCLLNLEFWLVTGLIAWFSGPTLALWWLYGAHRWRPEGQIAQIYRHLFGACQ